MGGDTPTVVHRQSVDRPQAGSPRKSEYAPEPNTVRLPPWSWSCLGRIENMLPSFAAASDSRGRVTDTVGGGRPCVRPFHSSRARKELRVVHEPTRAVARRLRATTSRAPPRASPAWRDKHTESTPRCDRHDCVVFRNDVADVPYPPPPSPHPQTQTGRFDDISFFVRSDGSALTGASSDTRTRLPGTRDTRIRHAFRHVCFPEFIVYRSFSSFFETSFRAFQSSPP